MNYQDFSEQFWKQGYIVIEDFFPVSQMDDLNKLILAHYGDDPAFYHNPEFLQKTNTEVIPWFPRREGEQKFDLIEKSEHFINLTNAILNDDWKSLYCMVMFSKQGTKGQSWHQDCPPEDAEKFNMNRLIYTHDVNEHTGGQTVVYPGSHKLGVLPAGTETHKDYAEQVILSPKKGTLVILHGHTWHRVLPLKGKYRVSTNFRCAPQGTPDDITDICVYPNMRYQFSINKVIEERVPGAYGAKVGY
ncbi:MULTISPECIES: phytanoyl-CoA dioxygenase family protein [unclassified Cellvibrio]|uniref:phytanoyl-CoA dioxygenase family protein n=1 Tax=unclassified Cellvibrio TaxID=2624793 RepID=UPI000781E08E|nr:MULTISPECIES: phytanoyl-CoA dioxygenase family protein [unclassified Cellvibrio]QEY16995.1 phytanoyl-CoA dioxygenase [Cellvibrio sp. KY-GH-1]